VSKTSKPAPAPVPVDKWQAEDDARTIIRAQEILGDAKRKGAAVVQLKKQATAANAALAHAAAVKDVGKQLKSVFGEK
jgi:hypothetical protein